jgi:sterol 3beta-glucosyltransferase
VKVLVAAHGTLGDVQPAVALARALRGRGHSVELAVPENLVPVAASVAAPVHVLGEDVRRTLHSWRERGRAARTAAE